MIEIRVFEDEKKPKAKPPTEPADKVSGKYFGRPGPAELLMFTRELRAIIMSGISITRGLEMMVEQAQKKSMKLITAEILKDVSNGFPLSRAMAKFPGVFNPVYTGTVRAGEMHGDLALVLGNLEKFQEREVVMIKKVGYASTYPAIALTLCLLFTLLTFKYILPNFTAFFDGMNMELPLPTKILFFITDLVANPWSLLLMTVAAAVLVILLTRYLKTDMGKRTKELLFLQIPILGKLTRQLALIRITSCISVLLDTGVSIVRALELAGDATGNTIYRDSCLQAAQALKNGTPLSEYFEDHSNLYNKVFTSMFKIGEESGDMPGMAAKLAIMYEQEVDRALDALGAMLEPLLIGFTGTLIGFIVISVFLPLYSVINAF